MLRREKLSIISWNVEGLSNCLNDSDFLNVIQNNDIIFCSDTWEKGYDDFCLQGYESVLVPRPESLLNIVKRGHGGVGLFYKSSLKEGINIVEKDEKGLIIVQLKHEFFCIIDDVYICFVYVPPSSSRYFDLNDTDYFQILEEKCLKYSDYGSFCIIGDLNARCGKRLDYHEDLTVLERHLGNNDKLHRYTLDKTVNASGIKLLQLCKNTELRIVIGRVGDDSAVVYYTYMSTLGCSLIDYVVLPCNLFPYISNFIVHDL